tara:strand:- start:20972 stop:23188 length:2217 start_codon:yes stop_codon:yes gene_type:complete
MEKEKLKSCLNKLSLSLGFKSLDEFAKSKENKNCSDKYIAVYPDKQIISRTDDKMYVDNLKVMTAQNLYDSKTGNMIKLTDALSKKLDITEPPIGWWASEKWDGIRALWDGEKMISRGSGVGKPKVYTYVPEWFKKVLPGGIPLDGEIWIGRGLFQKTSRLSTIKSGKSYTEEQINAIWAGSDDPPVVFKVFDIPNLSEPFEKRMIILKDIIKNRKICWDSIKYNNKKVFPLQYTEQIKIDTMEQLISLYNKLTSAGAEGIMLRAPGSPYELKRSKYMLKYKIKEDAECVLREYVSGDGKYTGMLGSIKCEILKNGNPSGVFTQIGTGLNDNQRTNYNKPNSPDYIPIGSIISFSYMEMTKDGIPRHPVYRGIRDDIKQNKTDTRIEIPNNNIQTKDVKKILLKIINKIATDKTQYWQFKVKSYKHAEEILKDDMKLKTPENYLDEFRKGGMKLADEEKFKSKNGEWKSDLMKKIDSILKTGQVDGISLVTTDPKTLAIENFTKIPGIGPSTALKIFEEEEISTIEDLKLIYSINNKILNPKQAIGLKHYSDLQERIPKKEMDKWNDMLTQTFYDMGIAGRIELVGSYRRGNDTSGDIDVLITTDVKSSNIMNTYYNNLVQKNVVDPKDIIAKGPTKIMTVAIIDKKYRHLDIFYHQKDSYPFALLFTTGSKEFNIKMRKHALEKGYSLNEQNLTHKTTTGKKVSSKEYLQKIGKEFPETEKDIFDFLNYTYISPNLR